VPRLFVAIDIPGEIREELANMCHGVDGARWTEMSQLHLTLEFIGEAGGRDTGLLEDALADVRAVPFGLGLEGTGFFPPRGRARVLWAGVTRSPALLSLQKQIRSRIRRLGIEGEDRAFSPHITLARFRTPVDQGVVAPFVAAHVLYRSSPFTVSEFHLYSSELARSGAIHTLEQSYPLLN